MQSQLCLRKISTGSSVDNMKITGLYGNAYGFSIDFNTIAVNDIHKYLMGKNNIK